MSRLIWPLMVTFVLLSQACNGATQSFQATQTSIPTQPAPATVTLQPLDTATAINTATALSTQSPTNTITAVAVTPTLDPSSATLAAEMGSMGALMGGPISQYFQPVGEPLNSWHGVPIMPQATAGQEFSSNIYSYIATAKLSQASQFYSSKAASLGLANAPGTGSAGSGDQAQHNMSFLSYYLTIEITSFDNDTGHVIVVISKMP